MREWMEGSGFCDFAEKKIEDMEEASKFKLNFPDFQTLCF
jgi:hypothetical protein